MIAGAHRDEVAFAGKIFILAGARRELVVGLEHEARIMERVHDQRQIGGRDDEARLRPEPLKWRCRALSGIANRLRGPHSKLFLRPSANSIWVEPVPSST